MRISRQGIGLALEAPVQRLGNPFFPGTTRVNDLRTAFLHSLLVLLLITSGCGGGNKSPVAPTPIDTAPPPTAGGAPPPPSAPAAPRPPATMLAVGDIGMCGYKEVAATADIVAGITGVVALLGDIAYMDGTERDFMQCYDPWWGRFRDRSRPVPGNHEYHSPNPTAAPYFAYFGANAGPPGMGWYLYEAGEWQVLAINSVLPVGPGSAQFEWVRATLAGNKARCTLAYWHHPRFSSGKNGDNPWLGALWRLLDEAGVDVVLTAHDHSYERFAPQDADGRYDPNGMRQFVVGTGGAYLYSFPRVLPNSEARGLEHGVLKLTLGHDGYEWEFLPIAGKTFRDSGSGQCN